MLSTFIAQILCHQPDKMARWSNIMFVQLGEECGWTDQDALQWFDFHLTRASSLNIRLVLNHFDECPETSRATFLAWMLLWFGSREISWKVFITSLEPRCLSKELAGSQFVNLQKPGFENAAECWGEVQRTLLRNRSKSPSSELKFLNLQPDEMNVNGSLMSDIFVDQLIHQKDWYGDVKSSEALFGLEPAGRSGDEILEVILDTIFRQVPGKFPTRALLKWLLYSARPLTVSEMYTFVRMDCDSIVPAPDTFPLAASIREFKQTCEAWLSGIVDIRDNLVKLRHTRLRTILMRPCEPGKTRFLWHEIQELEAERDITRTCLQFLSLPTTQGMLDSMSTPKTAEPYSDDLLGVCFYAVQKWPQHYVASTSDPLGPSILLDKYRDSAATIAWVNAYWALDNPITRPKVAWGSAHPLFVALGLASDPIDRADSTSMAAALFEAARHGRSSIVHSLLARFQESESIVMDALVAAASGAQQDVMLSIWNRWGCHEKLAPADISPSLIYRSSWLGLNLILEKLLEAGCSADPGGIMAQEPCLTSPLHQAVRFAHVETIKVLLKHGADTKVKTIWGRSILHTSISLGCDRVPKLLVESGGVGLSSPDSDGMTPLCYAAAWGYKQATKCLLQLGSDPQCGKNMKAPEGPGWLPLVVAAKNGFSECVRILLEAGTDPNQCGPSGEVSLTTLSILTSP